MFVLNFSGLLQRYILHPFESWLFSTNIKGHNTIYKANHHVQVAMFRCIRQGSLFIVVNDEPCLGPPVERLEQGYPFFCSLF